MQSICVRIRESEAHRRNSKESVLARTIKDHKGVAEEKLSRPVRCVQVGDRVRWWEAHCL